MPPGRTHEAGSIAPVSGPAALIGQLDRLAARLEAAARDIGEVRSERNSLFEAAGVHSVPALLRRIQDWRRLESEHGRLESERREAAARLRAVIDKVDMLPRDS